MKRLFIVFAFIAVNSIFTSCTDLSEDIVPNKIEQGLQSTGGEDEQDPDEEDDIPVTQGKK
ncbi:hypothetical protein [Tenacibaculum sp. Ill]|uniref:hypothetical protein n=1 Tax=Tenacibaculum sp. Ill TaxID=3445935 RepID=UPI003F7AD69E